VTEYTLNGEPLRNLAQRISTGDGLQSAAAILGDNIELPGMDGALNPYELGQQRRPDAEGRFTVALSMKGIDPTTGGWTAGTTEQTYLDNCDDMIRRWYSRSLVIDAERPDGSVRRMVGHLVPGESLDFTRERSSPAFGTYVAQVAIPSGRWTDLEPVTTGAQALATGAVLDLSAFAAATAVCTDLEVTFGAGANPLLTKSDGYLERAGTISSGRQARLYTRTGVIDDGDGTAWTPGYGGLDYSPGPRYFEIDPDQPLEAVLTHTGGGTMTVEVTGPRHYRTS
jgi:hypothetical protein